MEELKPGFIRETADYCPVCHEHRLMAYSTRGAPIHYVTKNRSATTDSIMKLVNKEVIRELVCTNCGNHFTIDYSLGFPRAIQDIGLYMLFLGSYYCHNN